MRTLIDCDEEYPVYDLDQASGRAVEVPDELYRRWKACREEWDAIQEALAPIYGASRWQDRVTL